jgi:DNA-binding protein Fis
MTRSQTLQADDVRQALDSAGADASAVLAETLDEAVRKLVDRFFSALGGPHPYEEFLRTLERSILTEALTRTQGNLAKAARLLGLPRGTLHDKAQKHGIRLPDDSASR